MTTLDHPIFAESISRIQAQLGDTGLAPLEQQVLERLIHSSGDFGLRSLLRFSPGACQVGLDALQAGALILTDTAMAAAAISPMAMRTLNSPVRTVLEWAPHQTLPDSTRTGVGMQRAWREITFDFADQRSPIVVIGSSPKALETLLNLVSVGASAPSLIVGMPVGFVGVAESKSRLEHSGLAHVRLESSRGGAGLAAAVVNALLRASQLSC